ncbi:hypothetical protein [Streptomyces sp. TLI_105]|uniref:hypothetical protein n=1 Tax=Streptomyces sp. TLI_105 TaxID=1881019 RepID=UPI00115FE441|nr:hypothetical protein [Streptomyces sp. TLI_105]
MPRQRSAAASRTRLLDARLEFRTREELLALVREQLAGDRDLRRRLELRAAAAGEDAGIARERILSPLDTRPFARYGYVEYADARAYGQQVAEAVTALRALTASGRAADAVEVAREALRALGLTYGEIADSDGLIEDVANGLAEAHLEGLPDRPARSGGDRRVARGPPAGRRRRRRGRACSTTGRCWVSRAWPGCATWWRPPGVQP